MKTITELCDEYTAFMRLNYEVGESISRAQKQLILTAECAFFAGAASMAKIALEARGPLSLCKFCGGTGLITSATSNLTTGTFNSYPCPMCETGRGQRDGG